MGDGVIMQLSYILLLQIRDLGAVLREHKDIKNNLLVSKNLKSLYLGLSAAFQGFHANLFLRNRC